MRLFEAIMEANHRALSGDSRAGLHPSDFPDGLPVVALSCIDPRLNHLLPEVLGVREEDFIWLRNAGNIVSGPMSSTMRSLALACAIKGGKEITIIGHSDCRVRQMSVNQLLDTFRALGINRASLPDNLVQFFGLFASERQNVINGVNHIRQSPLIGPKIPVHGLMVDLGTGRLEWLVNGYEHLGSSHSKFSPLMEKVEEAKEMASSIINFNLDQLRLPDVKIGELVLDPRKWLSEVAVTKEHRTEKAASAAPPPAPEPPMESQPEEPPTPIPIPPPFQIVRNFLRPKR